MFYDKLFSSLDFTLPGAATGRRGFPKEAMVCAFIVMKCEGVSQIADLADYLDNNRIIAHYSRVGGLYIWSYVEWSIYIIGLMNSTPLVRQYDILSNKWGAVQNGTIPDFCLFSANDARKGSYIKGLQVSSRFVNAQKIAHISLMAACAAARRAMGTRNGLQET